MTFQELDIKEEYRSKVDNVATDFYYPILQSAIQYDRAVGFFSSSSLVVIAQGLLPFVNHGGKIRILASPKLSEEDIEAIKKGYEKRKIIENAAIRELYEPRDFTESERLSLLANLIADHRLDIRLALIGDYGMYHEKMGIFVDENSDKIAFSGSMNESYTAMSINYESIDTFCSWKTAEQNRVNNKAHAFEKLWNNEDKEVQVFEFEKVKDTLVERYKKPIESYQDFSEENFKFSEEEEKKTTVGIPDNITLHDYQERAIEEWKKRDYVGIFDMATGTGKTYTGIAALCKLCQEKQRIYAVIVCPLKHLVEQWLVDLKAFGINPIVAYGDNKYKDYPRKVRKATFDYNLGAKDFVCILCTLDTFANEKLQTQIAKAKDNVTLIVDEAHNIGAKNYSKLLGNQYRFRLGLSATFERHNDEEGTNTLLDFFGEKCIVYSLEQAIREDKLTPYKYYPVIVTLTDEELKQYNDLSKQIAKNFMTDKHGRRKMNEKAKKLAIQRARVIAGASEKQDRLKEILQEKYLDETHILVYCGATKAENVERTEEVRQIDSITDMMGNGLGMKVAQFTSKENMTQRETIKNEFAMGETLQALVAIKCLDEGVNIPAIKTAFILASTTNPKEYIQRRGRVLRKYPGKRYAEIYDFITLPHSLDTVNFLSQEEMKYDKALVKKELERAEEFQRLADNQMETLDVIFKIKEIYGLFQEEELEDEQC